MFRYTRSYRFIETLQQIVGSYNSTPHSSLGKGLSPNQVTVDNEAEIWDRIYNTASDGNISRSKQKYMKRFRFKFRIGDIVRLSVSKYTFQRDYQHKWTSELFKISERYFKQDLPIYKIVDFLHEPVNSTFYEQELQKVSEKSDDVLWVIEKIIRKRKKGGKVQYLVKFDGWPAKFNSWVDQDAVEDIQK